MSLPFRLCSRILFPFTLHTFATRLIVDRER
jgi:hypothetical protein